MRKPDMPLSVPVPLGLVNRGGSGLEGPKDHLVQGGLTRREVVVRGSLALAAGSFLGRLAEEAAAGAGPARNWALGAFVNPANEREASVSSLSS